MTALTLIPVDEPAPCAHCGEPCTQHDESGLPACTLEHLLLARILETARTSLDRHAAASSRPEAVAAATCVAEEA
jgi:hypothetical protein